MAKVIHTTINHALDPALGGVETYSLGTADYYKRKFSPVAVNVQDIRGSEDNFTLKKQGFKLVKHSSSEKKFVDDEIIKSVVYPEIEDLLKQTTGCTSAKCFSHIIRRYTTDEVKKDIQDNDIADDELYSQKIAPAAFAHIDQGSESSLKILKSVFKEEATKLEQSRWGIINVWRPLGPVKRDPLGVCDSRTVADSDLVNVYSVPKTSDYGSTSTAFKDQRFQVLHLKENPNHRWYFASGMTPDEVLLITIYDTEGDDETGQLRRVPHSAFPLKESDDSPARESIETRALVFWDK